MPPFSEILHPHLASTSFQEKQYLLYVIHTLGRDTLESVATSSGIYLDLEHPLFSQSQIKILCWYLTSIEKSSINILRDMDLTLANRENGALVKIP